MVTYISHHLHHWRIWPYLVNTRCQILPCNICSQWCRQCLPSLFISLLWHHSGWRIQSSQCLQTSQSALGPRCASSSCASRGIREWGYSEPDEDGEALVEWASNSDLTLTHDAKQHGTFYWARWQKDYSPDLCWVTSIGDYPQPVSQTVLGDFPHSQHRPLLIHIGLQLPIIYGSSKKRWNFRKADWNLYSSKLERSVVTFLLAASQSRRLTNASKEQFSVLLLQPFPVAVGQSTHRVWTSNAKPSLRSTKGLETPTLPTT